MNDRKEYEIATLADFLALSSEQRGRCVIDMLVWATFISELRADPRSTFTASDTMTWVDDDRLGEISAVVFNVDGTEKIVSSDAPNCFFSEGHDE